METCLQQCFHRLEELALHVSMTYSHHQYTCNCPANDVCFGHAAASRETFCTWTTLNASGRNIGGLIPTSFTALPSNLCEMASHVNAYLACV